jgi:hypothetical protein
MLFEGHTSQTSSEVQGRVLYSGSGGPPVRGLPEDGEGISVNTRCRFTLAKAVQELTQCQILKGSKGQKMKTVCETRKCAFGQCQISHSSQIQVGSHSRGKEH